VRGSVHGRKPGRGRAPVPIRPGADEELVGVRPRLEPVSDRACFIGEPDAPDIADLLHAPTGTARPLCRDSLVEALERRLWRPLKRQKPGPKASPRDSHTRDLFELPERD
jgi:putative transposase